MNQATDPHLTESYTFTQIVNKSIQSLQSRKQLAEDTMNILTEIIELRSSCQLVWKTLNSIDKNREEGKVDFQELESAVYFMSKIISLVELLGVIDDGITQGDSMQPKVLKQSDIDVFKRIQDRMCQELKFSMQVAIDQYNRDLEVSEGYQGSGAGEENIKTIAHMFKLINMQEEGMKFYTNFIMLGKHNVVSSSQAAENSTIKKCDNVINQMYVQVEAEKLKVEKDGSVLLEEISFSKFYAEFQRVLIECIEDYGESISNLFGLDNLILFLSQIDRHSKEKGMQIIEHFMHNADLQRQEQRLSNQNDQLTSDQEFELDMLCDEISNFSYYYQNYRIYILNFLFKQMQNDIKSSSKKKLFQQVQIMIDFPRIDELMSQYVVFERAYIQNALVKGIMQDNSEFMSLIKNATQDTKEEFSNNLADFRKRSDSVMSSGADGQNNQSVLDMIDNFTFILDKCCKRALMSLSIANTCSVFNFINEILQEQMLNVFQIRFLIFSGLIHLESNIRFQHQVNNKMHKIVNLFEINDKAGFFQSKQTTSGDIDNMSNLCLAQTFNRFHHFKLNTKHLENSLVDEFTAVIKNDLKIGEDSQASSEDEEKERDVTEEKTLLKEFGVNTDVFDQTIQLFTETSNLFEQTMAACVEDLIRDNHQIYEQMVNLFQRPFKAITFNISNEVYEEYEQKEVIFSDSIPSLNKMLRSWKQQLNAQFFQTIFVKQLAYQITELVINGLMSNQAVSQDKHSSGGVSLLGALYIEKVLRQFKQFIQFLVANQSNSPFCEKMTQISQVLTCDTQEEAEEICITNHRKHDEYSHENLNLEEIRGLYSLRIDLG